jgi:hypothetical protein
VVFVGAKDAGSSTQWGDDEIWRFAPNTAAAPTQLTANNNVAGTSTLARRIDDLVLQPSGTFGGYAQGIGTTNERPEELFVINLGGGAPIQITPPVTAPGFQGIQRGGIRFQGPPACPAIVWIQGTNSRVQPTEHVAAYWNSIPPMGSNVVLRLTGLPVAAAKHVFLLAASQ